MAPFNTFIHVTYETQIGFRSQHFLHLDLPYKLTKDSQHCFLRLDDTLTQNRKPIPFCPSFGHCPPSCSSVPRLLGYLIARQEHLARSYHLQMPQTNRLRPWTGLCQIPSQDQPRHTRHSVQMSYRPHERQQLYSVINIPCQINSLLDPPYNRYMTDSTVSGPCIGFGQSMYGA